MSTNGTAPVAESYWNQVADEVAALSDSPVEVQDLSIRSNEFSSTCSLTFKGVGGYPLFAYYSVPRGDGPFVPLFQAPGYGSVVAVPAYERRARFAVMALCHRGQRLSDSSYQSAYPGLLTEGLPGESTYRWREIVADCLRAIDVLLSRQEVDGSGLAIAGNDLAALVAALGPKAASLLVVTPLLFSDAAKRASDTNAYPRQEFNDFRRSQPGQWDEAAETLGLFNPIVAATHISARTMIACTAGEKQAAEALASAIPAGGEVYVNTGYGHLDHIAQEDWLADACGVERSPGTFLPR